MVVKYKYFYDVYQEWLNLKYNKIKIQSYQRYISIYNIYIKNYFCDLKLKSIDINILEEYFENLEKNNISISTIKLVYYIISSVLNIAIMNGVCKPIDFKKLEFKKEKRKIVIFSLAEQSVLEKYLKENINIKNACLLMELYTGLRIGELCGLKWSDIDLNDGFISINKTVERIKNNEFGKKTKLVVSSTKSITSNRIIPIPSFLISILEKYKSNDNYYLLSDSEKLYDPRLMEYYYTRILRKCNIQYKNFHTIRHTVATRLLESGVNIKVLSELLGHSSTQITSNIYVHPTQEFKKKILEEFASYMSKKM